MAARNQTYSSARRTNGGRASAEVSRKPLMGDRAGGRRTCHPTPYPGNLTIADDTSGWIPDATGVSW
jgi:hypothetical protein